jgi:hypothetical protein
MIELRIRGEHISDNNYHITVFKGHRKLNSNQLMDVLRQCENTNIDKESKMNHNNTLFQLTEWTCSPNIKHVFKVRGTEGLSFVNDKGLVKHSEGNIRSEGNEAIIELRNGKYEILSSNYVILNDIPKDVIIITDVDGNQTALDRFKFTIKAKKKFALWEVISSYIVILVIAILAYIK